MHPKLGAKGTKSGDTFADKVFRPRATFHFQMRGGLQAWEMNRAEIALVNRTKGANLESDFGVHSWDKLLFLALYFYRTKIDQLKNQRH